MIKKEFYLEREDGIKLYKTYSDINHYIIQKETGIKYTEAIDVENCNYTYEETDEIVEEELLKKEKSDGNSN